MSVSLQVLLEPDAVKVARPVLRVGRAQQCARPTRHRSRRGGVSVAHLSGDDLLVHVTLIMAGVEALVGKVRPCLR